MSWTVISEAEYLRIQREKINGHPLIQAVNSAVGSNRDKIKYALELLGYEVKYNNPYSLHIIYDETNYMNIKISYPNSWTIFDSKDTGFSFPVRLLDDLKQITDGMNMDHEPYTKTFTEIYDMAKKEDVIQEIENIEIES